MSDGLGIDDEIADRVDESINNLRVEQSRVDAARREADGDGAGSRLVDAALESAQDNIDAAVRKLKAVQDSVEED